MTAGSHEQTPEPNRVQVQASPQATTSQFDNERPQTARARDAAAAVETDEDPTGAAGSRTSSPEDAGAGDSTATDEPEPYDATRVEPDAQRPFGPRPPSNRGQDARDAEPAEDDPVEVPEPNSAAPASAEPNDTPDQAGDSSALASFYRAYAEILEKYVREDGLVDYATLDRRRLELKALLMKLDELDPNGYPDWPRDEKLAFWINAYNLKMLEIIARNYPIQSSWWLRLTWPPGDIRHIKGIWSDYKFIVMDEEFTLAEVEQRFFHKTFKDPRVYLAITYAARSGPALRRRPYRGEGLDAQLDEQVKQFLSSPLGLQIDRRNMVVRLSALFKPAWRGKELVGRYGTDKRFKDRDPETRAVLNFITGYLSREDVYFLEVENYTLEYMNFDWRLNDTSPSY